MKMQNRECIFGNILMLKLKDMSFQKKFLVETILLKKDYWDKKLNKNQNKFLTI